MITPDRHMIDSWHYGRTAATWPVHPTFIETAAQWHSESCADHPEPSRFAARLLMPSFLVRKFAPILGQKVEAFIWCHGIDAGSGATVNKNVAYFVGDVDRVRTTRWGQDRNKRTPSWVGAQYKLGAVNKTDGVQVQVNGVDATAGQYVGNQSITVSNPDGPTGDATFTLSLTTVPPTTSQLEVATGGAYSGGPVKIVPMLRTRVGDYPRNSVLTTRDGITGRQDTPLVVTSLPKAGEAYVTIEIPQVMQGEELEVFLVAAEVGPGCLPMMSMVEFTASDVLAKFARVMVGDTPWGWDQCSTRLSRLEAVTGMPVDWVPRNAFGDEPGAYSLMSSVGVRPLDVDRRSALDVHRRTTAAVGRLSIAQHDRVAVSWAVRPVNTIAVTNGVAEVVQDVKSTSTIPLSAIPDDGVVETSDGQIARVDVDYWVDDPDDAGEKVKDARQSYDGVVLWGPQTRVIETDAYDYYKTALADVSPELAARAERMATVQGWATPSLADGIRLRADALDSIAGLAELVDNASRFGRGVRLSGTLPRDYPLPAELRAKSGRFGFSQASGKWELELGVEDADYSAPEGATFAGAAQRGDLTIGSLTGVSFSTMTNVRLI